MLTKPSTASIIDGVHWGIKFVVDASIVNSNVRWVFYRIFKRGFLRIFSSIARRIIGYIHWGVKYIVDAEIISPNVHWVFCYTFKSVYISIFSFIPRDIIGYLIHYSTSNEVYRATSSATSAATSSVVSSASSFTKSPALPSTTASATPSAAPQDPIAIPLGVAITGCIIPGTIALTFDDGPHIYTPQILNLLRSSGIRASFFINGQNFASINEPANQATVRRIIAEGHLLAHHTWSHPDMATLSKPAMLSQFIQLEDAIFSITGKIPTYFRAPYFSYNDLVMQIAAERGYRVINANIDTKDYENLNDMQVGLKNFRDGLNAGGSIVLAHDVHEATANVLVAGMIREIKDRGLVGVTVAECLGDPVGNWYRTR
ncbi:MAG: hypothetical protein Q9174_003061 [Haloplaca sp. 1 TL-2023]